MPPLLDTAVPVRSLAAVLVACLLVAAPATAFAATPEGAARWLVYFGTYTGARSRGIYVAELDGKTGRLGEPRLAAETENPSFLAVHPTRPLLYAVNEVDNFGGERAGSVSAFGLDAATGALRPLSRASSKGAHPCHLAVDRSGRHVLVANYSGGSVASLPLGPDGGVLPASSFVQHAGNSVDPKRQKGPHAHMVEADPENRFVLAADLGLDQVLVYRFDPAKGTLQAAEPASARVAPGSGPRHFAFSPDGRSIYVLNEMLVTVTAFAYDAGRLTEVQSVPAMPAGREITPADSGAEILAHPSGRFVYASLRGPDMLAVFARDPKTGRLTLVEHVASGGKTPRGFGIDPSGTYLLAAHQRADQVTVFRIDGATGRLTPTGQTVEIGSPVSVGFVRASGR